MEIEIGSENKLPLAMASAVRGMTFSGAPQKSDQERRKMVLEAKCLKS